MSQLDVVTGAFSYTGSAIATQLLKRGHEVRTVTGHPTRRHRLQGSVDARPYSFDDPRRMTSMLEGAHTLYNTYWVRFSRGDTDFDLAVRNTRLLIDAAKAAGIQRIVHISICNAEDSALPYFAGKQLAERIVSGSGIPYSIVRPTVLFGRGDVLVNNIAWLLRRFPFFSIPGDGRYPIQPVHIDDVARICVESGASTGSETIDAVGPETYSFEEFVRLIAKRVGSRAAIVRIDPKAALALATIAGLFVRDRVLTEEELEALIEGLAASSQEPRGDISFEKWLDRAGGLGRDWASELDRHYRHNSRIRGFSRMEHEDGGGDELRIA